MQNRSSGTGKILIVSVVVALLFGAASLIALQGFAGDRMDNAALRQADKVEFVVAQIQSRDTGGGAGAAIDTLVRSARQDGSFWVLSSGDVLLYVKDSADTNAYSGLSLASYRAIESVQQLYAGLSSGSVAHQQANVDGVDYLVSVMRFAYSGGDYDLALFTAVDALNPADGVPLWALYALALVAMALIVIMPTVVAPRLARAGSSGPEASVPEKAPVLQAGGEGASAEKGPETRETGQVAQPARQATQDDPSAEAAPRPSLLVRSNDELASYLGAVLEDESAFGGLCKVACVDAAAQGRVVRSLEAAALPSVECFEDEGNALVLVMSGYAEDDIRRSLAPCLQDDALIANVVPFGAGR